MQVCLYVKYGVARVCNLDKFVFLMKLSLVRLSLSYINKSPVDPRERERDRLFFILCPKHETHTTHFKF